ncbi:glycosyltransferase family 2 protein [Kaistella polysaccharea]|uniref:glycosyltransferase family 2 protein n=1 Tax=Kaistella polysaccharea TaxID=2878534 RepID=UPI001CF2F985|nr:glycosyltransferase family 2 protein [Kaistella polysaccharea]
MIKSPQISILIANYNNGHFFKDAFESLRLQTFENWEAIIIDDASTDCSVEIIQNLIEGDSRCHFYQNSENIGYQRTIVRAISISRTEIFGRLDPDDALHSEAIELSLKAHRENPEVGLAYSNIIFCDSKLVPTHINKGRQIETLDESSYNFDGAIWHFVTFKRKIYNRTSGIDPFNRRAEDQDIYLKMGEAAPVKYVDNNMYFYRVHDKGASTGKQNDKAFFWQWIALVKMAERRDHNLEDLFSEHFVNAQLVVPYKRRWLYLMDKVKKSSILSVLFRLIGKKF